MPLFAPGTRKGNKFWVYRVSVGSKDYEISTRETDQRAARRAAKAIRERLKEAHAEEQRQQRKSGPRTFADVAEPYCAERGVSAAQRAFIDKLKADPLGKMPVAEIYPTDIYAAANRLYAKCRNETKNRNAIGPAAAVIHFAAEQEWCPYRKVKKLVEREPETRRVADSDALRMIEAASGPLRKLLTFLYYQGWRITETLSLTRAQVDFGNGLLRVFVSKAGKWKTVPMDGRTAEALKDGEWYGAQDYAFPWRTRWQVYRELRKLAKALGIRATPHQFRHAFASGMAEEGASAAVMMGASTWTDDKSLKRYQAPDAEYVRGIMGRRGNKDARKESA